ncbi:asparagine synthase C-terminal domain-containing protein [Natrononativus amylolyticus]|uniref:asparagine synthase C-terminal domain-containing protein n=1 Tax=Natrononativus amylolyticus TaxID=2963434 RepID=UPI0020CF7840|nr:asparagine synthase C-terminal domain-containing protein [Natrononativus amylolyticus]
MRAVDVHCADDWVTVGSAHVSTPHDASEVAKRLDGVAGVAEVRAFATELRHPFALIVVADDAVHCVTDHLRSIPIYYSVRNDRVRVGDAVQNLGVDRSGSTATVQSQAEFLATGYVHDDRTLCPTVEQTRAATVTTVDRRTGEVSTTPSYEYTVDPVDRGDAELRSELVATLDTVVERLIREADGRQLVVPLSGGYDSRLLLLLLVKHGYENVLTYSHGRPGNAEATTARAVAENLSVPWRFVDYRPADWRSLVRSAEYQRYFSRAFNDDRLPGIVHMNWLAVRRLTRNDVVDDDCLFLPGHTAATMAEHLTGAYESRERIPRDRVVDDLFEMNVWLWDLDDELTTMFRSQLSERLSVDGERLTPTEAATAYERWEWLERESKWIHADLDVYRHFDVEYRVPFWDRTFVDFWQTVPLASRIDKRLLRAYTDELYVRYGGVDPSEATATELDSVVRRGYYALRDTPVFDLIRPLNSYLRYRKDPSGWPVALPESTFARIYTGTENRHSFFTLEALGLLDFASGDVTMAPIGGTLGREFVDRSRTAADRTAKWRLDGSR